MALLFLAARTKLFLKISLQVCAELFYCFVDPATTSVEPPVDGDAKSIISLGIGIVLFNRLTFVGALYWTTPDFCAEFPVIYLLC